MSKWSLEPTNVAEMPKGVRADGRGKRAKPRASLGAREREEDQGVLTEQAAFSPPHHGEVLHSIHSDTERPGFKARPFCLLAAMFLARLFTSLCSGFSAHQMEIIIKQI